MAELTRHGKFWRLGAFELVDRRELEELQTENAALLTTHRLAQRKIVELEDRIAGMAGLDVEVKALRKSSAKLLRQLGRAKDRLRAFDGAALDDAGVS